MKKIFTFLAAISLFTAASAQFTGNSERYEKHNDVSYNERHEKDNRYFHHGYYNYYNREREMKIAEINTRYDIQIRDTRNNCFLSRYRKNHVITTLECCRQNEIAAISERYRR